MPEVLDFGTPEQGNSIIKVIGVGGGGGNAVNHMYREGIHDVTFVLCNTDNQALDDSPVPVHLQLGKEGLGAGNKPEKARAAAEESIEDVRKMLNDGTRMSFITAGMGGGTGTGAAPVIARVSKELGILTVGIVTIPFRFEGDRKIDQALDGVEEMSKHVDALLVINNERLREIYPELSVIDAFSKADDTLSVAAKSIAEIITTHGMINLDFNDVKTVLKDGGVAIMSTGYGEGDGRVKKAIEDALHSPLLNDNDVFNSKKILLSINFSNEKGDNSGLMMDEMNDVHEFMSKFSLGTLTTAHKGLCFAGTHGKTTTSTMCAHLMHQSHLDCNAFLGGISKNYGTNYILSNESDYVVIEADEFDRSFHWLRPWMSVITATDPDHLDIYGTKEAYLESFRLEDNHSFCQES